MKKLGFFLVFFAVLCGAVFAQQHSATGTGFFVNGNGVIVTCAHVIAGGRRIMVVINGAEKPAEVVVQDEENDLAVLKVDYSNPYHFKVGDFDALSLGAKLQILGFPLTNYVTEDIRYTDGSLSARSGLKGSAESAFQHSVETQPGNSGGPIFNERFEVVGVASAVMNDQKMLEEVGLIPQNMNFGVKSEYILPLIDQLGPGTVHSVRDAEQATVLIRVYNDEAPAQGIMTITVANSTGYIGRYLYVSPRSSDSWGPDRLGNRYLYNGDSISVGDVPASEGNRYDLRLVDSDDDSYTMWDVVIRPNQTIEFTFNDFDEREESDDYTDEEPAPSNDGPPVSIVNNTGKTIYYLYVSPSSSDSWGEDWLGSDMLSRGGTFSVRLPYPLSETSRYDFMAEDADGNRYTKFRVTVTANARITFTANDLEGDNSPPPESLPSITVTNNTGYTFYYLYVSPSSSDDWGDDVLGASMLNSGGSTSIELPYPISHTDRYNIMAEDSDGDTYTKFNVRVTANGRVTFTFDDFDGSTNNNGRGTLPSITITNNTGYTFWYLYVSPSSSDDWGEDVLGSEVLSNGRSVTVQLPHPISHTDRYDIMAKDGDGDSYTKLNVRVSANGRVTFVFNDID